MGYWAVKNFSNVQPFWHRSRVWRTYRRQTDGQNCRMT